jgi:hypothetical protein
LSFMEDGAAHFLFMRHGSMPKNGMLLLVIV